MRVFKLELEPTMWRLLCRSALLLCLAILSGCGFGTSPSFLDEDGAIERAITTLKARLDSPAHVLNVEISPARVALRLQDPANRNRIEQWRLERVFLFGFNWERVTGPTSYEMTLVNPDLEANLFELDEVDFAAAGRLARAAVEHAALPGRAYVTRMEIARRAFVFPAPTSGEIRWTVDVSTGRESVQVFADATAAIVGMNIDGTERAKNLDILRELALVNDATSAFRFVLGPDAILTSVDIAPRAVAFETNVADPSAVIPVSGGLSATRAYTWNLNGLQRTAAATHADAAFGKTRNPFSIDDVDWKILPKIAAAAPAQLSMPEGRVTDIEVSRPSNPIGPPLTVLKIEVTDSNMQKGYVLADVTGAPKQLIPPPGRSGAVDWLAPQSMFDAFARLGTDLGQDRQYADITFLVDKVVVTAEDHMQPNSFSQILLTGTGLERVGAAATGAAQYVTFRIGDLKLLTVERLTDLKAKAVATLKMQPNTIGAITIGRHNLDPSPTGSVTVEIRMQEKTSGRIGRISYELDGTVIRVYAP